MTNGQFYSVWLVLFTVLLVPLLAQEEVAPEQYDPDLAWANVNETLISWDLVREFKAVTLTVSGSRGMVFQREFPAGIPIVFDLVDNSGDGLPDGHYTWELVGSPVLAPWVYDRLAVSRETGDNSVVEELRRTGDLPSERSVQAGYFTVAGGVAVVPEEPEPDSGWNSRKTTPRAGGSFRAAGAAPADATPADFVITDDLIVDGSACIGFDCVNGESFGFDTIRLKENNLRIKFDDTSTAASYPRNDWQLTANDSANGGAEKFSIDDIGGGRTPFTIEASAPSHSLYVDDRGRVGLGTSTPSVEMHIVDGDTPALRLAQDGSSGFAPQTWDVAGNETNFFVRDVTNGSTLPFRIFPDTDSSTLVLKDSKVGVGTASPSEKLHVDGGSSTTKVLISGASPGGTAGNTGFTIRSTSASDDWGFEVSNNGTFQINSLNVSGGPELTINESTGTVNARLELTAGTKTFMIDHPLDPANKLLYHSVVESPDMMNIYNGNVVLDYQGAAWVRLPEWFDTLNADFRYQLTAIGAPGPNLHVESEIAGNRFKIAGGVAGSKVSWQVTGIRHDAFAEAHRVKVEVDKPVYQQGYFVHPEVFGQPETRQIDYAPRKLKKAEEE